MTNMIVLAAIAAAALVAPPAAAKGRTPQTVAVVVSIPTPPNLPRSALEDGILKAVPIYRTVPGLLRKQFTIGSNDFGGLYLFTSRGTAEAWFNDAWKKRVSATYGSPATLTYYDVTVVLDNGPVPAEVRAR